jgi:hypothetical protein
VRGLATGLGPVSVRRSDANTLILIAGGGYPTGYDSVFRGSAHALGLGQVVDLGDMQVKILALSCRPDHVKPCLAFTYATKGTAGRRGEQDSGGADGTEPDRPVPVAKGSCPCGRPNHHQKNPWPVATPLSIQLKAALKPAPRTAPKAAASRRLSTGLGIRVRAGKAAWSRIVFSI